jgi:hypothetical protein
MILFLENKTIRANNSKINFKNYSDILEVIFSNAKCNELLTKFLKNHNIFDNYNTIIIHEGIYIEEERKKLFKELKDYCKNKILVKFSGTHSDSESLFTDKSLQISAKTIYKNLEFFLQEYKNSNSNILMLAYGKDWSLNKLLNNLQELNLFIENYDEYDEIDYDEFEDDFDLLELKKILSDKEYKFLFENLDNFEDEINLEQIKILAFNFKSLIQKKLNA